jgi:hypothetical protein
MQLKSITPANGVYVNVGNFVQSLKKVFEKNYKLFSGKMFVCTTNTRTTLPFLSRKYNCFIFLECLQNLPVDVLER